MAAVLPSFACGGGVTSEAASSKAGQAQREYLHLKIDNALDLRLLIGKDIKSLDILKISAPVAAVIRNLSGASPVKRAAPFRSRSGTEKMS